MPFDLIHVSEDGRLHLGGTTTRWRLRLGPSGLWIGLRCGCHVAYDLTLAMGTIIIRRMNGGGG